MDPFAILASYLAIISAIAKTSSTITSFVQTFRDAHQDLAAVTARLAELRMVLEVLLDPKHEDSTDVLPEAVKRQIASILISCGLILKDLDEVMATHRGKAGQRKWSFSGKEKIESLRKQLDAHTAALSLALEVSTLENFRISSVLKAAGHELPVLDSSGWLEEAEDVRTQPIASQAPLPQKGAAQFEIPADAASETATEIGTVFSTVESVASSQTSASSQAFQHAVIEEITDALLSREDLRNLYIFGISRVDEKRCRAHFRGFLKAYAAGLREEASDHLETEAAAFLGSVAGRVADEIRRRVVAPTSHNPRNEASRNRLESWLAAMKEQAGQAEDDPEVPEVTNPVSTLQDDDTSDPGVPIEPFNSIAQVRDFMLSARALDALIRDMKSWLRVDDSDPVGKAATPEVQDLDTVVDEGIIASGDGGEDPASGLGDLGPAGIGSGVDGVLDGDGTNLKHLRRSLSVPEAARGPHPTLASPVNEDSRASTAEGGRGPLGLNIRDIQGSSVVMDVVDTLHSDSRLRLTSLTSWFHSWIFLHLLLDLYDIFTPAPKSGHQRLRWRCVSTSPIPPQDPTTFSSGRL